MSVLLLIAAAANPVITVRATARIVSAARVGDTRSPGAANNYPVPRPAVDPANGRPLRLVEFQ